jgi:uncharacterized protein YndB with AHSA1/START domain
MKNTGALTVTTPSDREIVMTRVFDAPRELVFKAYTDSTLIPQWWGPRGFTTTVDQMDVRPGGVWRFVQRGPDGSEYAFNGVYREIAPPQRIVSTFEFEGMPGHVSVETLTLEEHTGKTKVTSTSLFQTVEDRDGMLQSGMEAGAAETYDRFAELLEALQEERNPAATSSPATEPSDREIVFTRLFDAPRELVWEAWTDSQQVVQWWGPRGFTTTTHEMDVRPGGVWRFIMHGPDGTDYPNKIVYNEVVPSERLAYTHGSDDGDDESGRFQVTVTFADHGGKTRLTMRALFASAEECDRVVKEFGAIDGGNQTLDRLAEHLAGL